MTGDCVAHLFSGYMCLTSDTACALVQENHAFPAVSFTLPTAVDGTRDTRQPGGFPSPSSSAPPAAVAHFSSVLT